LPEACGEKKYKLIIVDNNSPTHEADDSGRAQFRLLTDFYPKLQKQYPDMRLLRNRENTGYGKACNRGASSGRSDLILHINSDCIMRPGSIEAMIKDINGTNEYGIVAPVLLFPSDDEFMETGFDNFDFMRIRPAGKIQHVGLETNINGEFYHICVGWSPDNPKPRRVEFPYAVSGSCFLTRRSLWNRVGGFDSIYGQGTYEDVDYCMSIRKMGYNIHIVQEAVGTHYVSASAVKYNLPMPINENKQIFMSKWGRELTYSEWRYL
jgi:GT2 family glycosyltransferase